ncbi:hypothetical protein KIV40_01210 [Vibrio sp. D173a]|uniref:hypothetical protein n=1 Tax=Vibrio sp. D173a TaxID=2836349 RepID=UPI002556E652|nr:hypothetical protein [Vibrio sp. D173a]MDK9754083.1 hypothetical protein [Vibrio sp. D173a]
MNIFETKLPKINYIIVAVILASLLSFINGYILIKLFVDINQSNETPIDLISPVTVFGVVIFSPVVETLLMFLIMEFLNWLRLYNKFFLVLLCTVLMCLLHSLVSIYWGFFVYLAFVVFSVAYQTWRSKSIKDALIVVFWIHSVYNAIMISVALT